VTLADLLGLLRQRLLNAWDRDDQEDLAVLMTTFSVLRDELYASKNGKLIDVISALEEATRMAIMRYHTEGEVPSIETIQSAFNDN
jgi:hypothetical protein